MKDRVTSKRNKYLKKIPLFALAAILLIASVFVMPSFKTPSIYAMPDDYGISVDNIDNLNDTQDYNGITCMNKASKTYSVINENGFVTLARISQTSSLSGYTFTVAIGSEVEIGIKNPDNLYANFYGIGNAAVAFEGTLYISGSHSNTVLSLVEQSYLFNNLSSKAKIIKDGTSFLAASSVNPFALCDKLTISAESNLLDITGFRFAALTKDETNTTIGSVLLSKPAGAGLVASSVSGGACAIDLTQSILSEYNYEILNASGDAGGLFGVIDADSTIRLTLNQDYNISVNAQGGNAGAIAAVNNGSIEIKSTASAVNNYKGGITAANDKAAGLIAVNNGTAVFENAINISPAQSQTLLLSGETAGGIIGKAAQGSALTLQQNAIVNAVTLNANTAGGFIGENNGALFLTANKQYTISGCNISGKTNTAIVGGFIGKQIATTANGLTLGGLINLDSNEFSSFNVAGGLIGELTADIQSDFVNAFVSTSTFNCGNMGDNGAIGGYFGKITASAPVTFATSGESLFTFNSVNRGLVGGIVGLVNSSSKQYGLTVDKTTADNLIIKNSFSILGDTSTVGGAVARLGENAYFKADNLDIENTALDVSNADKADFIAVCEQGSVADIVNVSYKNSVASAFIDKVGKGAIVRFSGRLTESGGNKFFNIVKSQDHSLIFSESGFGFDYNPSTVFCGNDIGSYGQIINNSASGISGVITFDQTQHIAAIEQLTVNGNTIEIANKRQFAILAITLQTQAYFSGISGYTNANYAELLAKNISFTNNIDLTQTGIEQLTRADERTEFSGSVSGNSHTITLAIGENVGNTQEKVILPINNGRKYMGLFSAINNTSTSGSVVSGLTLSGAFTYKANVFENVGIGGLAGYASGKLTVTDCRTDMEITLNNAITGAGGIKVGWMDSESGNLFIGGILGRAENVTLTATGNAISPTLLHESGYTLGKTYLGGFAAYASSGADVDLANNTISSKITQLPSFKVARVGGFIAEFYGMNYVNVDLSGTTSTEDCLISCNDTNQNGGIIGEKFERCKVSVNSGYQGQVATTKTVGESGGLFYEIAGKLTVQAGFSANITFNANANVTAATLLANGEQAIVYIETGTDSTSGYLSGFKTTADNRTGKFDLFVAKNIQSFTKANYSDTGATGGIVSIESGEACGRIATDSKWRDLIFANQNENTRYYYNIKSLERHAVVSTVADSTDLLYWNVYDYTTGSLPNYVRNDSYPNWATNINGATADADMTNLCFYPTAKNGISFNFSGKVLTFGVDNALLTATDGQFVGTIDNQFAGLQSGIFSDITTTDRNNRVVSFENIKLSGNILPVKGGSGAFVCGVLAGTKTVSADAPANVTVKNVFFYGLTLSNIGGGECRPLLINAIDSYVLCDLECISQYTQDSYDTTNKTNNYGSGVKAASSLIGYGGISFSQDVHIQFMHIVFAGESAQSIFTQATLFYALNYNPATGSATYNFTRAEDWDGGHKNAVTYGREIKSNEDQHEYADEQIKVRPDVQPTATSSVYDFDTDEYLPYTIGKSDKLSVNRKGFSFTDGFGTYENPYVLSSAGYVFQLSGLLTNTALTAGWKIRLPKKNGDSIDYTQGDEYKWDGSKASRIENPTTNSNYDQDQIKAHLASAYYYIPNDINFVTESNGAYANFGGIGDMTYPFHGVISGKNDGGSSINMPDYTNTSGSENMQISINNAFAGFVSVSNGCAIYGLNINYGNIRISTSANNLYEVEKYNNATITTRPTQKGATLRTNVNHFGGVIGWNIGGDSVIENTNVTLNGVITKGHEASVFGGYVGLISGGGVSLRNLGMLSLEGDYSKFLYYNPYVGKIITGYAISNDADKTYDNSEKNYKIPTITKDNIAPQTGVYNTENRKFSIANAEQLLMLSFASTSGAMMYYSSTYGYGKNAMSRYGDYSCVGNNVPQGSGITITQGRYSDDIKSAGTSLFSAYFGFAPGYYDSTPVDIELTSAEYDLSDYKNAFRGIGSPLYGNESLPVNNLIGVAEKSHITLDTTVTQYNDANKFETDSYRNFGLIIERPWLNSVNANTAYLNVQNVKMSGNVSLIFMDKNGVTPEGRVSTGADFCVGAFAGFSQKAKFTNIELENLTVRSPGWAGGVTGGQDCYATKVNNADNFDVVNGCTINNLTVEGVLSAGGVFGKARPYHKTFFRNITMQNSLIKCSTTVANADNNPNLGIAAGGVVGYFAESSSGVDIYNSNVSNTAVICEKNATYGEGYAGGFIGRRMDTGYTYMSECTLDGCFVSSFRRVNDTNPTEYNSSALSIDIQHSAYDRVSNIIEYIIDNKIEYIIDNKNSNITYHDAGGFAGNTKNSVELSNCSIKSQADSTIILGQSNASGITPTTVNSKTYIVNNGFSIQTSDESGKAHPIYILSNNNSAGLFATSGTSTLNTQKVRIAGTDSNKVYIAAFKNNSTFGRAAGLAADCQTATVSADKTEISNCVIIAPDVAGLVTYSGNTTLTDVNVFKNHIIGYCAEKKVGGLIGYVGNILTANGLYVGENIIRNLTSNRDATDNTKANQVGVGIVASEIASGKAFNANHFLLYQNDAGCSLSDGIGFDHLLAITSGSALSGDKSLDNCIARDKSNALIYKNNGSIDVFAISRKEANNDADYYKEVQNGTAGSFIYFAYGAPTYYKENYTFDKLNSNQEDKLNPEIAINAMGATATGNNGEDISLNGDTLTSTGTDYTVAEQGGLNWWYDGSEYKTDIYEIKQLQDVIADINVNSDIQIVEMKSMPNDSIVNLLSLITNNNYNKYNFTVDSERYKLNDDGKFIPLSEQGSIVYNTTSKLFEARKENNVTLYDDISAAEKKITVLTLTFTSKNDSTKKYVMNIGLYYQQILEIETFVSVMENEVYNITSFVEDPKYQLKIPAYSKYSLYVEYAYNSLCYNLEDRATFNFKKRLYSGIIPGDSTSEAKEFYSGTKFILIDLNSVFAYGYKYYYYELSQTDNCFYVDFTKFTDSQSAGFVPKTLQSIIDTNTDATDRRYIETNSNYPTKERYLVVVIPSENDDREFVQFNLRAQINSSDTKITVKAKEKLCSVAVWSDSQSQIQMSAVNPSFSNGEDEKMQATSEIAVNFPEGYVVAMQGKTVYGTHIFRIKDENNRFITLPEGTAVTIKDINDNILHSEQISSAGASLIRYSIGNIMANPDVVANNGFSQNLKITLDFSDVSVSNFKSAFDGGNYNLQHDFYLSTDQSHYTAGKKTTASQNFMLDQISSILVTVAPEDYRYLAVNLRDSEDTDSGIIHFKFNADFSALSDFVNNAEQNAPKAKVKFSIKKMTDVSLNPDSIDPIDRKGEYVLYEPGDQAIEYLSLYKKGEADIFTQGIFEITHAEISQDFTLVVNRNYNFEQEDIVNYRLVVEVVALDDNQNEIADNAYRASSYFVFLLCDIITDIPD